MVLGFHRRCWTILILLVIPGLAVLAWLGSRPSVTPCKGESLVSSGERAGEHKFEALQVVVQPWQGRHQVYGVFKIPDEYKVHRLYSVTLTIQGSAQSFAAGSPENEERDGIRPEPGYYIRRAYIPTRTALWFLFTGNFGNLRNPCHWWLVYADRTS